MISSNKIRTAFGAPATACFAAAAMLMTSTAFANSDNKVLGGIEKGANATGHGIERGANATRKGVNSTAEKASAPVRRWGESLGRKLPHGSNHVSSSPAVGPQGNAP